MKRPKAGHKPGTLIHIGERKMEKPRITVIDYNQEDLQQKEVEKIEDTFQFRDTGTVSWINIDGLHEIEMIDKVGQHYKLHPLLMEDILNTQQRSKLEDYDDYIFIVLRMLYFSGDDQLVNEQISIVLGKDFVLTFQEQQGDVFDPVRERIKNAKGNLRKSGSDYLTYALMDAVVDHYFIVLDKMGNSLEDLEIELLSKPDKGTMEQIHYYKRQMIFLRKSVWPMREVVTNLQKGGSKLISDHLFNYLRDVHDHTMQVADTIESYRDVLSGMLDVYLSIVSNRMNEVMKVLTVFASIFIPLTFIVGVYGMNFKYIPELDYRYGYHIVWGVMIIVTLGLLYYFHRKKWI